MPFRLTRSTRSKSASAMSRKSARVDDPGIVHQDVEIAVDAAGFRPRRCAHRPPRRHRCARSAPRARAPAAAALPAALVDVRDDDARALRDVAFGDREPDAARPAGHDRNLCLLKPHGQPPERVRNCHLAKSAAIGLNATRKREPLRCRIFGRKTGVPLFLKMLRPRGSRHDAVARRRFVGRQPVAGGRPCRGSAIRTVRSRSSCRSALPVSYDLVGRLHGRPVVANGSGRAWWWKTGPVPGTIVGTPIGDQPRRRTATRCWSGA